MDRLPEQIALEWNLENLQPLQGDVGTRRYFRVDRPTGGSAILVLYPDREPNADDAFQNYLTLHSYLTPISLLPKIYRFDAPDRAMLLEDLGDCSLEGHLSAHPEEELEWADRVAKELENWVDPLTMAAPRGSFFMLRSFDKPKYDFEWSFCKEHFFNGLLKKNPPLWLDRMMEQIHCFLIPRAKYLAHRDFHVRNLMVSDQRLMTIDFQDARLAPATYDLASIMFDGYWNWSQEAKQILASRIFTCLGIGKKEFWGELNCIALQRNFKALGTFACQLVTNNKTRYAPAIPRTLRHIHTHFERLTHGEGVIQTRNWLKIVNRMFQPPD
ncbi:MAG: phosphotransferase [Holophagaceae bacterium]|nr:phosphotransferase [Holophagaceae bacterium]